MNKLSVIIPHYNSEKTLKNLLNSIPNENWIEVIVVDDNSDNDIFDLKKEFENVLFFKAIGDKKGAGAARNVGLDNATGTHFLFADSDDFFVKNAFLTIKEYMDSNFEIVFFNPTSLNIKSNKTGTRHLSYSFLIDDYIKTNKKEILFKYYVPWSKLISSKLIRDNKITFDEVIASNDINFSLKATYFASKVKCSKEQIYCVTESNNSLTKQISEEVLDSRFEAISRYNDFLQLKNLHKNQGAMSGHLWNTRHFGFYKFLYRFFYCKYKKYPIFYDFKHILGSLRHFK